MTARFQSGALMTRIQPNRMISSPISAAILLALLAGCASDSLDSVEVEQDDVEEEMDQIEHEPGNPEAEGLLVPRSNSTSWYRWTKGEATKLMQPISTHICALAMVRGQLDTNTTATVRKGVSFWELRGDNPGGNTLQLDAVCEPLSQFTVNAGKTVSVGAPVTANIFSANNSSSTVPVPDGTAPILTTVKGQFNGGGERARTVRGPGPT